MSPTSQGMQKSPDQLADEQDWLKRIRTLAKEAHAIDAADQGGRRQVAAENALFAAVERRLTPRQRSKLRNASLDAKTTEERIRAALRAVGIRE